MPLERIRPYLEGKNIYLAQDNDKSGNAQAVKIQEAYPQAQRLTPPQGKDWNESWQKEKTQPCARDTGELEL